MSLLGSCQVRSTSLPFFSDLPDQRLRPWMRTTARVCPFDRPCWSPLGATRTKSDSTLVGGGGASLAGGAALALRTTSRAISAVMLALLRSGSPFIYRIGPGRQDGHLVRGAHGRLAIDIIGIRRTKCARKRHSPSGRRRQMGILPDWMIQRHVKIEPFAE